MKKELEDRINHGLDRLNGAGGSLRYFDTDQIGIQARNFVIANDLIEYAKPGSPDSWIYLSPKGEEAHAVGIQKFLEQKEQSIFTPPSSTTYNFNAPVQGSNVGVKGETVESQFTPPESGKPKTPFLQKLAWIVAITGSIIGAYYLIFPHTT